MVWRVGLTGGIGSGKSAVAALFQAHGAAIIDTDAIAHELTAAGGDATTPIRATFGPGYLTPEGALDRIAMRTLAFADPTARQRLEAILHPLIRTECDARLRRLASADFCLYAVLVVPLLVESGGYRERVERICVVDCPEAVQIARVMARNGLNEPEVAAIIAAQATRAERLAVADDVIDNGGDLAALTPQVAALHARYLELAGSR